MKGDVDSKVASGIVCLVVLGAMAGLVWFHGLHPGHGYVSVSETVGTLATHLVDRVHEAAAPIVSSLDMERVVGGRGVLYASGNLL